MSLQQTGRDINTYFPAFRAWWFFAFAGDKWQVTPKLTLDLGLRWEFYPPATPAKLRRLLQLQSVYAFSGHRRRRLESFQPWS